MKNGGGKPIYILYGVAGIGKSTVAKTAAEYAANDKALGASFFFSRDEDNRKTAKYLFTTLAYHLAYHYPVIAERINKILEGDPEVAERDPIQQFNRLIARPLQAPIDGENPIILIIDALDECEENDAETILSLLAQEVPRIARLRVLITARPEPHIRSIFVQDRSHHQFRLHDIDRTIVEADIRSYLEFRLSAEQVRRALPDLRSPIWQPTKEQMEILVGMSGKLFIIAATTTAFILDRKQADPARRLAILLDGVSVMDFSGSKYCTVMDRVYMGVVHAAQPDPVGDWTARFQACVGTVVLLHDPLPCDALAQLIDVDVDVVLGTLSNLHSLLAPSTSTQTFRVHHKSFPDFIVDPDRCILDPQLCIDRTAHNFRIARRCLYIMTRLLKPNICGLEPSEWHMNRAQILHRVQHKISPCLAYACTYWASHLVAALGDGMVLDADMKEFLDCFVHKHLLAWLEVLSIVGRVDAAHLSLDIVNAIGHQGHFPNVLTAVMRYFRVQGGDSAPKGKVRELFDDARRFIQRNLSIIRSFPMEIYHSALYFTPRDTALFSTYSELHANNVQIISGSEVNWNPALAVLKSHAAMLCVTFSADGSRLASASKDSTIHLWDSRTGHDITTLRGHAGAVCSVVFSADDSRLASASCDETILLWDGRTGHHIATLAGHSGAVHFVNFSGDGSRLASASEDRTVRLWDSKTGGLITTLRGHSGPVNSVTFSPDGLTLASASGDKTVRLWDGRTGDHVATLSGHSDCVNCVAFSADGSALASASNDHTVQLRDGKTGRRITTFQGHRGWVRSVTFSADGSTLASGAVDLTVRLWNRRTGVHIATFHGHSGWVQSVTLSPDGSRLASASDDKTVRLWDSRIKATPNRHSDFIHSSTFSPDGSKLALVADDGTIRLQEGRTGIHIASLKSSSNADVSLAFSTDGSRLASGSGGGTVRLWDVESGRCTATLEGHSASINSVAFSVDESRVASASDDKTVRLWGRSTGCCIAILSNHSGAVTCAAFSSDGARLASASADQTVRLWDGNGNHISTLKGHSGHVMCVQFSPDGSSLASASWDGTVRLWDGRTGDHIATLARRGGEVSSATFSADGFNLISGMFNILKAYYPFASYDNTVLIWDITDKTRPYVLCQKTVADWFYLSTHNCIFLLETRTDPTLCGLTVLNLGDGSSFNTRIVCWFPPDFSPRRLAVHPTALTAAVLCDNGHLFLLDISKALIY